MIKINKPKFDLREIVGGTLDNNVKYIFINDKSLEKSFVTVAVNVGSYANPKDYDGLAHFLEHMLFMGSKKYPDEKYYFEELNKSGGSSNAYTDSMETVYYFNVFNNGLGKMFDIFSRFFIDPLFSKDSISRELNAVDSEHKKNINSDMWRKHQFILDLIDKSSSLNNFGTGSLHTLKKKDIREKLIEFYNKYYTSNNISICIASSKSFSELKQIIDKSFGLIPKNNDDNKFEISKPLYSENKLKFYFLKSISNVYAMSYIFEIPNQYKHMRSIYFTIFTTILINKSEKSLYFNLTNMGYLNNIFVEIKNEGILEIQLILTKDGMSNLDFIESSLYQAIEQITNLDINKFAIYYKKILKINFNTINKFEITELCNMLAVNHYYYKTKNVFKSNFILWKIKSNDKYKHKFIKYINKNNVIKLVSSQKYPLPEKLKYSKTLHYNAEYSEINLKLKSIINQNISYDENDFNNKYLDVNPILIMNLDKYDIPTLLHDNQWYGGCSKFGEPLVYIALQINNNKYFESATNYVLTQISCLILNYLINIIMYKPFELSNSISFSPVPSSSSININISTLNDVVKIKLLLNDLNKFLLNIDLSKLSENYINNLIVSLKESYENINYLNPSSYSQNKIRSYIYDTEYPVEQLISVTQTINFSQIKEYIENLLDDSTITSFVYGNIEKKDISKLLESYNKYFKSQIIIPVAHEIPEIITTHPNSKEKSNSVTIFYYMGELDMMKPPDIINNIIGVLGTRILSQSFFDDLRTKKQLGYLVNMGMSAYRNKYYVTQKIQSDKPVDFILENINEFNSNVEKYLMDSEFEEYIESIKQELLEPEYSLSDKVTKYLPEITSHEYIFDRQVILYKYIDQVSREAVVNYFNKLLLKPIRVIINGH